MEDENVRKINYKKMMMSILSFIAIFILLFCIILGNGYGIFTIDKDIEYISSREYITELENIENLANKYDEYRANISSQVKNSDVVDEVLIESIIATSNIASKLQIRCIFIIFVIGLVCSIVLGIVMYLLLYHTRFNIIKLIIFMVIMYFVIMCIAGAILDAGNVINGIAMFCEYHILLYTICYVLIATILFVIYYLVQKNIVNKLNNSISKD